jgi:4a-hydroxytetrahydrobiopterin dehydratase
MTTSARSCVPCRKGTPPLDPEAAARLAQSVPRWTVAADGKSLSRRCAFPDFDTAFALVERVCILARTEDHHPDIAFGWGYAAFTLTTHAIGGLHSNDFFVAAGIDTLAAG